MNGIPDEHVEAAARWAAANGYWPEEVYRDMIVAAIGRHGPPPSAIGAGATFRFNMDLSRKRKATLSFGPGGVAALRADKVNENPGIWVRRRRWELVLEES